MRNLILNNGPLMVWSITVINAVIFILFAVRFAKRKQAILICSMLMTFGLFYDALILSLGSFDIGASLETLSQLRFVSHGALVPLLFPICAYGLGAKKKVLTAVWIFTGIVMAAGIAQGFATELEIREIAGIVRYAGSDATPAWADTISTLLSFGTVLPLIVCGIVAWIREKTPYLFLSGFFMFVFAALGPATGNMDINAFISMIGEVLMMLFILLYCDKLYKNKKVS